jgi:hypothetical protein
MLPGMGNVSEKLEGKLRPPLERLLEPGEQLVGMCVAVQQTAFRGNQVALGITERRVLVQPLDRRYEPKGDAVTIGPGELAEARADGMGDEWWNAEISLVAGVALTLRLRTTDGTKLKLNMMRGGDGFVGRMGGGEVQEQGTAALAAWFERYPPTA